MYNYLKNNKNVILIAVAMFTVSLTALFVFLSGDFTGHNKDLGANIVNLESTKENVETKDSYEYILKDHDGPLVIIGSDGLVQFSSDEFNEMAGYTEKDTKDQLFYSYIHPEDLAMFVGAFGKTLSSESAVMMIGPYRMRDADGEYNLQMASFYPIKEDENVVKIVIVIKDITSDLNDEKDEPLHKKSTGKKIRDTKNDDEKKLIVEKLAMLISPFHEHSLSLHPLALKK